MGERPAQPLSGAEAAPGHPAASDAPTSVDGSEFTPPAASEPAAGEPGEIVETWPEPFRPEDAYTISLSSLALAEFYGTQTTEPDPAAQPSVTALEDWLRSHGVGGAGRKAEGFYGEKTKALVNAAYAEYLPDTPEEARNGVVSPQLATALKAAGAPIGA